MSGIIKGAVKAVKGIFKGIKKVFKKITSSTIGKVLLAAATIYLGGAAFGMWETPFASVNGAFVSGTKAAATAAGTDVSALPIFTEGTGIAGTSGAAGASTGLAPGAVAGEIGSAAIPTTAGTSSMLAPTAASESLLAGVPGTIPGAATGATTTGGALSKIGAGIGKVAKFAGEHPLATTMGLSAIASGLGPDEEDLLSLQDKLKQKRIDSAYSGIGEINLGVSAGDDKRLKDTEGTPIYEGGSILARLRANSKLYGGRG